MGNSGGGTGATVTGSSVKAGFTFGLLLVEGKDCGTKGAGANIGLCGTSEGLDGVACAAGAEGIAPIGELVLIGVLVTFLYGIGALLCSL